MQKEVYDFENRRKKMFVLVDFQNDFVQPQGALTTNNGAGSPDLVERMEGFFKGIPGRAFDRIIATYDTHRDGPYQDSEEGKLFPPHCLKGRRGTSSPSAKLS